MIIKLESPPEAEPVTVDDVKSQLVLGCDSIDDELEDLIAPAREVVETILGRALISQTWARWYDVFPSVIELPWAPLQSVVAITYVDGNGDTQTLDSSVYTVDSDSEPGRIYPAYGQCWPASRSIPKAVKVQYVAGYGDEPENVPARIRLAIMLLVGSLANNREDDTPIALHKVPWGVRAMLSDYRMYKRAC